MNSSLKSRRREDTLKPALSRKPLTIAEQKFGHMHQMPTADPDKNCIQKACNAHGDDADKGWPPEFIRPGEYYRGNVR